MRSGVDYQIMKSSKEQHKARSAELNIEVNEKKQLQTSYEKLEKKSMELEQETGRIHDQIAFIKGGPPE